MKRKLLLLLLLGQSLCLRAESPAPAPARPAPWTVFAECRMIVLPQKAALPLIAKSEDVSKSGEVWDELEALIDSGGATLAAELIATQTSGEKTVTRNDGEVRFEAGFEPRLPYQPALTTTFEKMVQETKFDTQALYNRPPEVGLDDILRQWPLMGAIPVMFALQLTGESLEWQAEVSDDGNWIAGSFDARHVRLLRTRRFDFAKLPDGGRLGFNQPEFYTVRDSGTLRLPNGGKILFGVHKLAEPEKTFELFLLRVIAAKGGR